MSRTFLLPSGKTTKSAERYIEAWRELGRPFCEILHAGLYAYDPGLAFVTDDGKTTFEMEGWIAIELYKTIIGKELTE
jgi:hypothetical protein